MEFDPSKAQANFRKHRIRFSDAESVFFDPQALTLEDRDHDEMRWITIGMDAMQRVLVVVYTYRNETPRLISARRASPNESRQYYEQRNRFFER